MLSMALTQPQDGGPSGLGVPTLEHRHERRELVGWQRRAHSNRRSRVLGHGRTGLAGTIGRMAGVRACSRSFAMARHVGLQPHIARLSFHA